MKDPRFQVRIRSLRIRSMLVVLLALSAPLAVAIATRTRDWDVPDLTRVTLASVPAVLLIGWWLGWRMVRPLKALGRQVLEKLDQPHPKADLDLHREDEFGDLAAAFNALLERLESRTKSNEAFVADLAHELKNPVAAIRAAAESLERGAIDAERAARLSRVLADSSRRLDEVVTQLLDLARTEAGMPKEARSAIDLAALVRGVTSTFAGDERYARVKFEVITPETAVINGVALRIEAAIRNLIDNAASFAGEGGWVRVEVSRTERAITVRVTDGGPGIREQDLDRVFERFFTTRPGVRGTGLGLAMVRAVAEAHGGSARVVSKSGEGACFEVELPA